MKISAHSDQRHDAGQRGVLLGLRHFVVLQDRLAGDADVQPGHLRWVSSTSSRKRSTASPFSSSRGAWAVTR